MGQLALPGSGLIYPDASVIIYSVEKVEPYWSLLQPFWAATQTGDLHVVGSELLLLETLVKPIQNNDIILENAFRQLLTTARELRLLPITRSIIEEAAKLRATIGIKTPDAIHAATALAANCDLLLTNDRVFTRVPELKVTILSDALTL